MEKMTFSDNKSILNLLLVSMFVNYRDTITVVEWATKVTEKVVVFNFD